MIDTEKRFAEERAKEKIRKKVQVEIDSDNYDFFPAKKQLDYYDNDVHQRVAVYARVSTDSVSQTNSFELQKKYYEDFVVRHPNWTLVKIYADQGISGTSLKKRDSFNEMIADCKAGKIDMIITKSVSRFARNVVLCIGIVRDLAEMKPPVGVFFESECIFSLNEDSQMALSFQATMAEEESHTRSRSMEAGNDDQLIINSLIESYGLTVGTKKSPGTICAISTVESIYKKWGYHVLNRVLRLIVGTWEGDVKGKSLCPVKQQVFPLITSPPCVYLPYIRVSFNWVMSTG